MSTRFAVLFAWSGFLLALGASAQDSPPRPPPWLGPTPADAVAAAAAAPAGPDDAALAQFVDGYLRAAMADDEVAGAVVAVVDRSRARLVRGYGLAAVSPTRAVDAQDTLFRLGSVSKTFTYVAAMQLAEQGRLDLQAEANRYLPPALQLPDDGFAPVRVHHLMTHTAGFEDSALGHLFAFDPARAQDLESYLAAHRPRRVRAPGKVAVYSNYAVGLLGAIVARVAGRPFDVQLREAVFAPLGMAATRFDEPVAQADRVAWSEGFEREDGRFVARPFERIAQIGPAGSASSTGADMARWMRLLLGAGELDGTRVLETATFDQLAAVDVRNADAVGGIASGFFRERYGHHESLEHGGATLWFHSNLVVLPDAGVGVFVSTNSAGGRRLARELPRQVIEFLLADAHPPPLPVAPADFPGRAAQFTGTFLSARRNRSTFEKLTAVFDAGVHVRADGDALVVDGAGPSVRYIEESPLVFRAADDGRHIAFKRADDGTIASFAGSYGHTIYERVGVIDAPVTLLATLGLLAATSIGVLLCAWRRSALPTKARIREGRVAAGLLVLTAAGWLAALVMLGVALAGIAAAGGESVASYPAPALRAARIAL
ncbi:MAG: beta-lactamase family protein, partial [Xanthomonadales bacterium]|nr:beta-lactamase family protein [Xanthomonadales bacterium]